MTKQNDYGVYGQILIIGKIPVLMKRTSPHILLVNPWITDFAAYNFWIKPLGLLSMASLLRGYGYRVTLIDCLDGYAKRKKYGDGNFEKARIEKPDPIKHVPRYYSQYGISEGAFLKKLSSSETPDVIGFTSGMTYWYPGLFKSIRLTREFFKDASVLLGGIYATLCHEHASKYSGADFVIQGAGDLEGLRLISQLTGAEVRWPSLSNRSCSEPRTPNSTLEPDLDLLPYPAFDLYSMLDYVCMATSRGCPLKCTYCASQFLTGAFVRRDPARVVEEIDYWATHHGVRNIAFYDDALLMEPREHIVPILKEVMRRGIRCHFHAPNGLHIRTMDEELAFLLYQAGFKTIRLGFETSYERTQVETGNKVKNDDFLRAVRNLKTAGYSGDEIGVYIMVGLPGQMAEEAEESIAFVKEMGARPIIVEYSPIPHTVLFEQAKQVSPFDLENEPLCHNNSILPCQWEGFTMADYRRLKESIRRR
jgi:pyruvate-formate lyase-activating enzyme